MARIKDLKATFHSGIAGPMIVIEVQVNCGFLDVEPTIKKREQQGFGPDILYLEAFPAADQEPESFRIAALVYRLKAHEQYEEVEVYDSTAGILGSVKVVNE